MLDIRGSGASQARRRGKAVLAAAWLYGCLFAAQSAILLLFMEQAYAAGDNGKGGGNAGGGGGKGGGSGGGGNAGGGSGGGGNAGGGSAGGGNAGGGSAGGSAGGNSGNPGGNSANSNAGGNSAVSGGGAKAPAGTSPATEIADPSSVLGLRESGLIQPLDLVYDTAEEQLGGRVVGAKLMIDEMQRLTYDLRVVTEDGRVRVARYDAASLALLSIDDQQIQ